jgi:hypothetical protein
MNHLQPANAAQFQESRITAEQVALQRDILN